MAERQITVLVENTAGSRGLLGEHGLSLWIENRGKKILFDTGQGSVLRSNAEHLSAPLDHADAIVLSHGHYDHTGGLHLALEAARSPCVYAHPRAFAPKFVCDPDGSARDVGIPLLDQEAARQNGNLIPVEGPMEIADGFHLTGPIPRTHEFEDTGGEFFRDPGCAVPDDLIDDQAAFLELATATVVILGCAHAGVINTLSYVQTLTDGRPIHAVIGGMHLHGANPERLEKTVAELRRLSVEWLSPCHCTGFAATARLWNEFPGRCTTSPVGTVIQMRD